MGFDSQILFHNKISKPPGRSLRCLLAGSVFRAGIVESQKCVVSIGRIMLKVFAFCLQPTDPV